MKTQIPPEVLKFKEKNPKNLDFKDFDTSFVSKLYDLIESGVSIIDEEQTPALYKWFRNILESNKQTTLIFFLRTHSTWEKRQGNILG